MSMKPKVGAMPPQEIVPVTYRTLTPKIMGNVYEYLPEADRKSLKQTNSRWFVNYAGVSQGLDYLIKLYDLRANLDHLSALEVITDHFTKKALKLDQEYEDNHRAFGHKTEEGMQYWTTRNKPTEEGLQQMSKQLQQICDIYHGFFSIIPSSIKSRHFPDPNEAHVIFSRVSKINKAIAEALEKIAKDHPEDYKDLGYLPIVSFHQGSLNCNRTCNDMLGNLHSLSQRLKAAEKNHALKKDLLECRIAIVHEKIQKQLIALAYKSINPQLQKHFQTCSFVFFDEKTGTNLIK